MAKKLIVTTIEGPPGKTGALLEWLRKNCGTGEGGFAPGNTCGGGGGTSGQGGGRKPAASRGSAKPTGIGGAVTNVPLDAGRQSLIKEVEANKFDKAKLAELFGDAAKAELFWKLKAGGAYTPQAVIRVMGWDAEARGEKAWAAVLVLRKNCGTGSGGFQPGNDCAGGGGTASGSGGAGGGAGPAGDPKAAKRAAKQRILADTAKFSQDEMLAGVRAAESTPDKLFKMDTPGTKLVPIAQMQNIRARPEGIANATQLMYANTIGHPDAGRRDPISVQPNGDGTYKIYDGNSTYDVLKRAGWQNAPVREVDADGNPITTASKPAAEPTTNLDANAPLHGEAGGVAERGAAAAIPEIEKAANVRQKATTQADLWKSAESFKPVYDDFVANRVGKAVAARSYGDFAKAMEDVKGGKPGAVVILAPLKTANGRGAQKVRDKYGGDWGRLTDVVRGTIAVDTEADIGKVVDGITSNSKAMGFEIVELENKYANPPASGYRDVSLLVRGKDGHIAELQINTKAMVMAKEKGHKIYEKERVLAERIAIEKRAPTIAESVELEGYRSEQRALYNTALAAARKRSNQPRDAT